MAFDRARSGDPSILPGTPITDVVAVVGVMAPTACKRSVEKRLTQDQFPFLFLMMQASRFVVYVVPVREACSAGGAAGGGDGHDMDLVAK